MRAFIAVDLEDEEIRKKIERLQDALEASGARMKLVEPRNFHVTLKFLGEINESLVERIKERLEGIDIEPFEAQLIGVGVFPSLYKPRVVFVDIPSERLSKLMEAVDRAVHSLGFELERRAYRPHLTVARIKGDGYLIRDVVKRFEREYFGTIKVEEIRLKKSKLTSRGPIYSTVFSVRLSQKTRDYTIN